MNKLERRKYGRRYYHANKTKYLAGRAIRQARSRKIIQEAKSVPCADCGIKYPHYAMDFDHIRGDKLYEVGDLNGCSPDKIYAEIEKCEVVCSNCHRIRTWARKDFLKRMKTLNKGKSY